MKNNIIFPRSAFELARTIVRVRLHLSRHVQTQILPLIALMIAGAIFEVFSIAAVLPFITSIIGSPNPTASGITHVFSGLGLETVSAGTMSIIFVSAIFCSATIRLLLVWRQQKFVSLVSYDLCTKMFYRVIQQPYLYHIKGNSSEILSAVNKSHAITSEVFAPLMNSISSAVISAFIIAGLLIINPGVAVTTAAIMTGIYLIITLIFRKAMRRNSERISRAKRSGFQYAQEALGAVRDVIIDRTEKFFVGRFAEQEAIYRDAHTANSFMAQAPRYLVESVGMAAIAIAAFYFTHSSGGLINALPVIGALALGAQRLLPTLQQVYYGVARTIGNQQVLMDVVKILELPDSSRDPTSSVDELTFEHSIRFDHVTFRYDPNSPTILDTVNLTIKKGARVGIVGRTGSGKSTLVDIIIGLLRPTSGLLYVDNTPITDANIQAWQRKVAHVPQSIYLADASIAENIAFGQPLERIDVSDVIAAAKIAGLMPVIEQLPSGIYTRVGERGVQFSGGQRQRIGIARAIYKNASILIFDEATSALDQSTEQHVLDAIRTLPSSQTVIMISHRPDSLREFDQIITVPVQ